MTMRHTGAVACATALLFTLFTLIPSSPAGAEAAHDDQITRLYITALGRQPDTGGHAYWTSRRIAGETLTDLARVMINTDEARANSSGDIVVDAYRNALGRLPDTGGYAYWTSMDPAEAVAKISDSEEHRIRTGTLAPPPAGPIVSPVTGPGVVEAETGPPAGWVDAGHGVFVPPILLDIRWCESRDDYRARNPVSTAAGAYQFLTSSWRAYGHDERFGVARADLATPPQQDQAALITWQMDGTRPWLASRHCWG